MTNLQKLIKNNFIILLGNLQGKKKRNTTAVAISLLVLGIVGIFALYSFQAFSMYQGLGALGLEQVCFFHACLTTFSILLIIGIMRVSANSRFSDTDMLLSLPLKKSDIIISKTVNKYLFDLFFVAVLFLPYVILHQAYTQFSILISVFGLLAVLLLPLLSVGISYIVDFIITHLFNRFKFAKIMKSIFSVLIYLAIMALLLIKTFSYGSVQFGSLDEYFMDRPISYLLLKFVLRQDVMTIIGTIALTVIPFIIGMLLFSFSFGKSLSQYSAKDTSLKFNSGKSSFKSLFKKEITYYFGTPAYVINTIIGPIMILALGVIFSVVGLEQAGALFGTTTSSTESLVTIVGLIFCGATSLTLVSCASLSLEGKNLWILSSTPVNEKVLFMSKILLNILLVSPIVVISSVILTITFSLSIVDFCIICFIPILLNLTLSFGGLIINIWLPKFNWSDEVQVVKQSLATLLTMVFGLVLTLIPVALTLIFNLPFLMVALISACLFAVVLCFCVCFLFTKGIQMFRKINY